MNLALLKRLTSLKLAGLNKHQIGRDALNSVRDWRSPKTADDFANLDFADFAQEFLRRNPEYCRQYHALLADIERGDLDGPSAMAVLAKTWGLSFPVRPRPRPRRLPGALGARIVDQRCRPRRRTG